LLAQQQQAFGGTWDDDSIGGSVQYARSSSGRSGGDTGSSTARTLLALLESNRDVLEQLPKVCCCLTCQLVEVSAMAWLLKHFCCHIANLYPPTAYADYVC
jgi:hypothetical protein